MNAKDLKDSILQLAIQGKLVEQCEKEGAAKELLDNIETEKKQLIKEGKIKKEKKLPEITDNEVLFDIPESWEWTRISNVADMYTGNSIPKSAKEIKYSKVKDGYDYIGTKDVNFDYTIDYENGIKIPFEEEKFRNSFKDSILMCIEGGSAGRKIGILDKTVCFGNKLCSFNLIYGEPRFLYYYLQSPMFFQTFRDEMTGIIGGVSITKLKSFIIPIPPLEEQKRIVAKIEELLPYVDKYDVAYSAVEDLNKKFPEDMQKSILQYAIQGKLVEQREEDGTAEELCKNIQESKEKLIKEGQIKKTDAPPYITEDEIPFDIPENWKWVRLSDISIKITDGEHKTPKRVEKYVGFYLLSARNVLNGEISLDDVDYVDENEFIKISKRCNPKKGDILISCSGSVGRCSVVRDDNNYVMVRSVAMVSTLGCYPEYIMYAIQSGTLQKQIKNLTKQTAQANLFLGAINQLLIPIPPLEEQKRIVIKLKEVLPRTKKLEV